MTRPRVLAIALDAAEWTLVEPWARAGYLPTIMGLLERGASMRLTSTAEWLAGSPWPGFYTGKHPPDHGFVYHLQWRPERMRHERVTPDWLSLEPFYRRLGDSGKRVVAVDVPVTLAPDDMGGFEVTGWSTHDRLSAMSSWPRDAAAWVTKEFGASPITIEVAGVQKATTLLALRDSLIDAAQRQAALCETLAAREAWDLFIVGIGAAHRGGHKLWDRSSARPMSPEQGGEYDRALRDVYAASDAAVGRIIAAAGRDATILCFALHGMQVNTSGVPFLKGMLARILGDGGAATGAGAKSPSLLARARAAVPLEWRAAVKERLPERARDALSTFWRGAHARDWSRTRAFPLMSDLQGLVQINLRGREARGIVEPGAEFESLRDRLVDGLMTFRDIDTGDRLVHDVARGDRMYPDARNNAALPDLVIRWNETPAIERRGVVSERFGAIPNPNPGVPPEGRSGHHGPPGWLIAVADHVKSGWVQHAPSSYDLNATIHHLLGVPHPDGMLGDVIPAVRRP